MTDEELIRRLEETPPEDWSADELAELRRRATESTAVRNALAEQLLVEQALTQGLTQVRVTADQVFARLAARRRGPLRFGKLLRLAAALLIAVGVGGTWYALRKPEPDDRRPEIAAAKPTDVAPLPQPRATPTSAAAATRPSPLPTATASSTATAMPGVNPPAAVGAAPNEPWTAMLEAPPVKFDDFWSYPRRLSRDVENLQRWWNTITGQQRPVGGDERFGLHMAGFFELRAPWPAGKTLTIWTSEQQNDSLRLHLWSGEQGLTLEARQRPHEQWTAYGVTKRPHEPLPQSYAYAADDLGRAQRTGQAPVDLRYHDGRIFVSRGDILLLSAPLEAAPTSVYFEGTVTLKGIGLVDVADMPERWLADATPPSQPIVGATWLQELPPGAKFEPRGDAGGTLSVADTTKPAWAALPLEPDGLYVLDCDVAAADAQTGLYLGDEKGTPRYALGFHTYRDGEALHFAQARYNDTKPRYQYQPKQGPPPALRLPAKIRLVCGAGVVKVLASRDGRSWGEIMEPLRGVDGVPPTVGIYCAPGKGPRRIALAEVRRRTYLKPRDDFAGKAPAFPAAGGYGEWLAAALADDDLDEPYWLAAQALDLLTRGVRYDVARTLLAGLATPIPTREGAGDAIGLRLIDFDTLALAAEPVDTATLPRWSANLRELGDDVEGAAKPAAEKNRLSALRRRWMEAPLTTNGRLPALPPEIVRDEILNLFRASRWNELDDFCRELHFFGGRLDPNARKQPQREPIMALVDWAAALAERRRTVAAGRLPTPPQIAFQSEWRHPLVEQFGKEGYNVLAELETALQEKAYADACRIITGVTAAQAVGLLPNAADPDLLVSLPGAVAQAMRTHAELRTVMQRDYGDLAQLRFRQATAEGDVDAVEALTTQFYGTAAAAQAQTWLGDRALAQGDAPRAETHYRAARSELPDGGDAAGIAARLRLAAALQGRDSGDAPAASVRLGDWTLTPAEFERTCRELRARAPQAEYGPRSASETATSELTSAVPPPARPILKKFATFDGDVGKSFEQPPQRDVDYYRTQIATTFTAKRLIVSNRFQVAAFELADGKLAWRTALGGEQGRSYQWPRVAMPPVVVDDRLFVRRLTANGPELACLNVSDGRVAWRSPRGEVVASDPLVAGDRVLAVVFTVPQQDTLDLELTTYEARSGKVVSRRPLAMLRDYWKRELPCSLLAAGDTLLVGAAGCVVGCSPEGELRWLRKLPWVPPSVATGAATTLRSAGEKCYVAGMANDYYMLDVRGGGLDPAWTRAWFGAPARTTADDMYAALAHDGDTLRIHLEGLNNKLWRPRLHWQSATSGYASAAWPKPWQKLRSALGPFAAHDGRYFAFTADDAKSPVREIVELVPGRPLDAEEPELATERLDDAWRLPVPEALRKLDHDGWSLVQGRYDEKLWLDNKLFLEDDCRLTLAATDAPAIFTRGVELPESSPKKLKLQVAPGVDEPWLLEVRIGSKSVLERKIEAATERRWQEIEVDLAEHHGRTVQLTLVHKSATAAAKGAKPSLAAWRGMAIVEK